LSFLIFIGLSGFVGFPTCLSLLHQRFPPLVLSFDFLSIGKVVLLFLGFRLPTQHFLISFSFRGSSSDHQPCFFVPLVFRRDGKTNEHARRPFVLWVPYCSWAPFVPEGLVKFALVLLSELLLFYTLLPNCLFLAIPLTGTIFPPTD